MNLKLIRLDPAFRDLPLRVLPAVLVALVLRMVAGDMTALFGRAPYTTNPYYSVVYLSIVLGFGVFIISPAAWTRVSRLHATLPIPARTALLARTVAIALGVLVPILSFALIASVSGTAGDLGISVAGLKVALQSSAVLMLVLALLQAPSPTTRRANASRGYTWYAIAVFVGASAYLMLVPVAVAYWAVPLALAIAVTARTYVRTPDGHLEDVTALESAAEASEGSSAGGVEVEPSRAWTLWTVARILYGRWDTSAPMIPGTITLVAVGFYMFMATIRYRDGESMWWITVAV
nr:hypothetical protein [Actinomycetota bacterium]